MKNHDQLPRLIFTRRPLLERIVNAHPAMPACIILVVLFSAIGLAELVLRIIGYGR